MICWNGSAAHYPAMEPSLPDLSEVSGQAMGKRGLEIAAAGSHNLLFVGPPGAGKAHAGQEASFDPPAPCPQRDPRVHVHLFRGRETGQERDRPQAPLQVAPPYHLGRRSHRRGTVPAPGEVSLAHNGVLFLDEMPEFRRSALEALRQPLEDGRVTVSRASSSFTFPANFQLVAALNPCPCGFLGHPSRPCECTPLHVAKYRARVSGPLLDRIDIHLWIDPVEADEVLGPKSGSSSSAARDRVAATRSIQLGRGFVNARIPDNSWKRSAD